jgi:hypothetical protein
MTNKLFNDVKTSITEIVADYKRKREHINTKTNHINK